MPKRPRLKIGDVCRISKRMRRRRIYHDGVLVVTGFSDDYDTSDGRVWVHGHLTYSDWGRKRTKSATIERRNLWRTGYNVLDKSTKAQSKYVPVGGIKNNDGRKRCFKCGQPTTFVPGAVSGGYNMCKNRDCEWYDN